MDNRTTEKETIMPLYMFQAAYTSEAWAAQIQHPQNWWWQAENGQFGREKMNTFATV
jgi:hypothetical protein